MHQSELYVFILDVDFITKMSHFQLQYPGPGHGPLLWFKVTSVTQNMNIGLQIRFIQISAFLFVHYWV